jgi:hypothetical protein
MSITAMKQALEALEIAQNNLAPSRGSAHAYGDGELWDKYDESITALRTAINAAELREEAAVAEPYKKQSAEERSSVERVEPVAWVDLENWLTGTAWPDDVFSENQLNGWTPLYTTPPAAQRQWVGLTAEEIEQEFGFIDELLRDCVHRTEAKLREKNSL